jgi:hypothetical protein
MLASKSDSSIISGFIAASKEFFIAFLSSYLAGRGFSIVSNLLTKKRNRLSLVERGDLRLLMGNMAPNIEKLVHYTKLSSLTNNIILIFNNIC